MNVDDSRAIDKASINIYVYFELKFNCGFNAHKNFWIRPRKFFNMRFSIKCVGKHKFLTSNSKSALNFASNDMYGYMIHFEFA